MFCKCYNFCISAGWHPWQPLLRPTRDLLILLFLLIFLLCLLNLLLIFRLPGLRCGLNGKLELSKLDVWPVVQLELGQLELEPNRSLG